MYRYSPLLLGLGLLLASTDALAQNRISLDRSALEAVPSLNQGLPLHRISGEAVRRIDPSMLDASRVRGLQWNGMSSSRGATEDSASYFDGNDVSDVIFFTSLEEYVDTAPPGNEIVEASTLFSPGYGEEPPPDNDEPVAGQVSTFGFCTNDPAFGGPQDGGTLLLLFSKFEANEPGLIADLEYDLPSVDFAYTVALDPAAGFPATGGCFDVDVTADPLFFENDEEYIWAADWLDSGDFQIGSPGTTLSILLDDGLLTVTPPVVAGYYNPARSGAIFNYVGDPDNDPGLYYVDLDFVDGTGDPVTDNANWVFWSRYLNGAVPVNDVSLTFSCGPTSATCDFPPRGRFNYTYCYSTTSPRGTRALLVVSLVNPDGTTQELVRRSVTIRPGAPVCTNGRFSVTSTLPDGYYEIRAVLTSPDEVTLFDYDHSFFRKTTGLAPGRTTAPPVEALASTPTGVFDVSPNPFEARTTIRFSVGEAAPVRLGVYDLLGREVALLVNDRVEAGSHEATFDASGLAAGVYVYRLQAGQQVQTGRLTLLQ